MSTTTWQSQNKVRVGRNCGAAAAAAATGGLTRTPTYVTTQSVGEQLSDTKENIKATIHDKTTPSAEEQTRMALKEVR